MKTYPILNYEITGSGEPVVLLHGFMASGRYWHLVVEKLALKYKVISIDLLGFGKSPKPRRSRYDYAAHLGSLEATLDHLGVTSQFILVGHSMGSLVALRFASEQPSRVKRLILTNMPVMLSPAEAKADIFGVHPIYKLALNPVLHGLFFGVFRLAVKFSLLPGTLSDDLKRRGEYIYQSNVASRMRSLKNVIIAARLEADLAALTVKTTLLTGVNDRKIYLKNILSMALGSNILTQNVDGGHHLPLTRPDLVVELIG